MGTITNITIMTTIITTIMMTISAGVRRRTKEAAKGRVELRRAAA